MVDMQRSLYGVLMTLFVLIVEYFSISSRIFGFETKTEIFDE